MKSLPVICCQGSHVQVTYLCIIGVICCQGDHMQVSNSDEEDDDDADEEFHYDMELGDHK